MKSGLEGRNNDALFEVYATAEERLNEVRPGRPEQCDKSKIGRYTSKQAVSMKSGLEGRNNHLHVVVAVRGRQGSQ